MGINLKIAECKTNVYKVLNQSGLEVSIRELILESVLNDVRTSNVIETRKEYMDKLKSIEKGGKENGKEKNAN